MDKITPGEWKVIGALAASALILAGGLVFFALKWSDELDQKFRDHEGE